MASDRIRIGVVAPGSPMQAETAQAVTALAARLYPENPPDIHFHPQCFLAEGHFAGLDQARADAFLEIANDEAYDSLWFGRGGYGAVRILDQVLPRLRPEARSKAYLGYSDAGFMLAALYSEGFGRVAHGPVAQDIRRGGGEVAAARALAWLTGGAEDALEPSVDGDTPTAAFNLCILSHLIGTPWQPDLEGHVLMVEEVSEHHYRIDRFFAHITANPAIRKIAGLRLGRCSDIPDNDPPFGEDEEAIARMWCGRAGIPYLGRADIGHDAANRIVPFGLP